MKPTKENIAILKAMGFVAEHDESDVEGWWWYFDNGWCFRIDAIKNIKSLVKRLISINYHQGMIDVIDKLPLSEKQLNRIYDKADKTLWGLIT